MGHRTLAQQKMGHERKKVENRWSRALAAFYRNEQSVCYRNKQSEKQIPCDSNIILLV